jgi:DNA-binding beta-propeller fold protein YncE
VLLTLLSVATFALARKEKQPPPVPPPPPLQLEGGRQLSYEGSFAAEEDVKVKRGFWTKVLDFVAGAPEKHRLLRPYSVTTDSRGRVLVTDPGAIGLHLFDFEKHKYKWVTREGGRDPFVAPQCVAVDGEDNIYVTDSEAGKIFVFNPEGKFKRVIGSLKGGEGFFKRPTGIAIDTAAQRIYVSDTLRHKIFVLDLQGSVVQEIGHRGQGDGEFNFPTELRIAGNELLVVDAMNFRVQMLDKSGKFVAAFGKLGDSTGAMMRPKGVGLDSEGDVYIVDALFDTVQVFDRSGRLLYYFGQSGDGPGDFQLPAGLQIDRDDRIYVVDSYNHRVEIFRYTPAAKAASGGAR